MNIISPKNQIPTALIFVTGCLGQEPQQKDTFCMMSHTCHVHDSLCHITSCVTCHVHDSLCHITSCVTCHVHDSLCRAQEFPRVHCLCLSSLSHVMTACVGIPSGSLPLSRSLLSFSCGRRGHVWVMLIILIKAGAFCCMHHRMGGWIG